MTRVCHLTSVHNRYDTRVFYREAVSLARAGYEVFLIVADGKGNEQRLGVNIVDVGKPRGRLHRMFFTTAKICKTARRLGCKIAHYHDPELMFCAGRLRRYGIKVIYDIHENRPEQILYKDYIPGFLKPAVSRLVEAAENRYIRRTDYNIIPDPGTFERVQKLGIPHIENVRNYGLPTKYFLPWNEKDNAVIYAGLIADVRGIFQMLDMILLTDAWLYLAGPWDNRAVREKAEKHPGWKKTRYFGTLDKDELDRLVARCKIGLVPLNKTPFFLHNLPRKIFEYMLAGIPMITNNIKTWEEILQRCKCGLSVDTTNPREFAGAVNYLLTHPEVAEKMGQNALQTARKLYSWENEEKKLLKVYRQLLSD